MVKLLVTFSACLDDVVEEAGDGKRADATDGGGDGGEVCAVSDLRGDVAF